MPRMDIERSLINEVRINPKYTQYLLSSFENDLEEESEPKIIRRTMFTSDYLKKLNSRVSVNMLPPNCRYIEVVKGGFIVAIEEPPAMRTIKISRSFEDEMVHLKSTGNWERYGYEGYDATYRTHSFSLAFPYVIFLMSFDINNYLTRGYVFLRNQQLVGMSDYLLKAPLTNIGSDQRICWGSHVNSHPGRSLIEAVQHSIMVYWSAEFNTDYTYNLQAYKKNSSEFGNYFIWQYYSKTNPMFIYDANWVRIDENFGQMISLLKRAREKENAGLSYTDITSSIFSPSRSDTRKKLSQKSKRESSLFYDIANGIPIGKYFLHLGDPFEYKSGEIAYVDSFIGFEDGGEIKYLRIDKNGKSFLMKVTPKLLDYITESSKKLRYSSEVILPKTNVKIKNDDILVIKDKYGEYYGHVDFIRENRTGEVEVKIGPDYYLASQLEATKFNLEVPMVDGVELRKNEKYIVVTEHRNASVVSVGAEVTYEKVTASDSDLRFLFKYSDSYNHGEHFVMPMQKSSSTMRTSRIYEKKNVRTFERAFRIGRKLHCITDGSKSRNVFSNRAWELPEGNGFVFDNVYRLDTVSDVEIKSLVENGRFFLPGVHLDLEFNIGDKVISVDWANPSNMLKVKEIAGFSFVENGNSSRSDLFFILTDKDGNLFQQQYIYGYKGICRIGSIRKITNIFEGVRAGTKIISNKAGIHGFPKTAVNIIVGFITDTGGPDPLVLCSNCQTLWFSDMVRDFKLIKMTSKKWKSLSHAPIDLSKIRPQAGDIIDGTRNYKAGDGYLMCYYGSYRNVRAQILSYYTGFPETVGLDSRFSKEYIYDCIPAPRLSPSQIRNYGLIDGYTNFHGMVFATPKSKTQFINEPGRVVNVSSSSE